MSSKKSMTGKGERSVRGSLALGEASRRRPTRASVWGQLLRCVKPLEDAAQNLLVHAPAGVGPGAKHILSFRNMRKHGFPARETTSQDRKSTRLNSSHGYISYAVFCL